jgi:multiple sugar transport system permease protein
MRAALRLYQRELVGIAFLLPNICGFLAFTLVPLVLSFALAFSNWDIQLHNIYKTNPLQWIGFENFRRLLEHPRFWQYFGNTLFLMMGIPFSIAGSLGAALLLSQKLGRPTRRWIGLGVAAATMTAAATALVVLGFGLSAIWLVVGLLFSLVLFGGITGGTTVYRTMFYMPHFTAGVATFILWGKMYNPISGPINRTLAPILDAVSATVNALPSLLGPGLFGAAIVGAALTARYNLRRLAANWRDDDIGPVALVVSIMITLIPPAFGAAWLGPFGISWALPLGIGSSALFECILPALRKTGGRRIQRTYRIGENLVFSLGLAVAQFTLIGLALVLFHLPVWASDGLAPPLWLIDYGWAKPALMIMSLWAAIGSNNMILYLAGLSNVSPELHDAANIDGASRLQRFWHVTWPQLAPVTFFIVVMSIIHGLQGGFEMARTMTEGGPAGATTTLSYFVYIEGFQTGHLGFACAVAWTLFAMIFVVTMLNVRFGNRYVND